MERASAGRPAGNVIAALAGIAAASIHEPSTETRFSFGFQADED